MERMKTVREAYQKASYFLHSEGITSFSFEAELMLRHLLDLDRTRFFMELDKNFPEEKNNQLWEWLQKRKQGVPLQYLLGEQHFYGRSFYVKPGVLIPRPETEILVEQVLQKVDLEWHHAPLRVVDVGTGSGVIAITLAVERPQWEIIAIDCSSAALHIAKKNAQLHGVKSKITWYKGSWLLPLLQNHKKVDILVSNPPYIPSEEISTLEKQVRDHEPHLALDGGVDGLDPYREMIRQTPKVLNRPGLVAFEVGEGQSEAVAQLFHKLSGSIEVTIKKDLADKERIVMGWLKS